MVQWLEIMGLAAAGAGDWAALLLAAPAGAGPGGYAQDWRPFATMAGLLVLTGLLAWAVAVVWTTLIMHRPARMTAGRALARLGRAGPEDVGLQAEEIAFDIPDAARRDRTLRLAGWWIPHPAGPAVRRTCVMLHGYGDSKHGSLAWAPLWQDLGFHLLLLDIRAHGESGGRISGGGVRERDDLHAVLDRLPELHPAATRQIVLFGTSFGAMIAAACCAGRQDIAALVMDSPVDGWATATRRYADLLGLPLAHAHRLRMALAEAWLGVRFESVRPVVTLPEVRCPVLAILPREDVLVAPAEAEAIGRAVEGAGACNRVWHADSMHNLALAADAEAYERRLGLFLQECAGMPAVNLTSRQTAAQPAR